MHPAFRKDSWLRGVFDLSSNLLGDPALLVCAYCKPVRYLLPLYEHQWVDAQDGNGDWYEAQIRTVGDGCALVHYKGFKSHQDELHSWPYNRLAVLHSYTDSPLLEDEEDPGGDNVKRPRTALWELREPWASPQWLSSKEHIEVLDSLDNWIVAYITGRMKTREGRMVLVHFEGWPSKWDEWLNEDSYRITYKRARRVLFS